MFYSHCCRVSLGTPLHRWHEHDATEIKEHADLCITETIKSLEGAGWAADSVKVIGALPSDLLSHDEYSILLLALRCHKPERNHCRMESKDRQASLQSHCLDGFAYQKYCGAIRAEAARDWHRSEARRVEERQGRCRSTPANVSYVPHVLSDSHSNIPSAVLAFHFQHTSQPLNSDGCLITIHMSLKHTKLMICYLEQLNHGSPMFVFIFL